MKGPHKDRDHININMKLDAAQPNGMIRWPSKVLASETREDSCIMYLMIFTNRGYFPTALDMYRKK